MLHQMLTDEKEAAVREAAVRSLAVVLVHCDDDDKFPQVRHAPGPSRGWRYVCCCVVQTEYRLFRRSFGSRLRVF